MMASGLLGLGMVRQSQREISNGNIESLIKEHTAIFIHLIPFVGNYVTRYFIQDINNPVGFSKDCDTTDIYANDSSSAYCFDTINNLRKCYTNDIPSHSYGPFGGNGAIVGQEFS